jgi:RsiW-degrading membrane proteinase PrsW (M82 family)
VLGTALVGLGLFVPLIEELFKPIGVLLLLRRPLTAAQGFALGALCGAGYALAENLTIGADAETWALISVGRFGTTIMHIFTAALSGYALARAKNEKRYLALIGTYLLNVFIHGAWNSLVVLNSAAAISAIGPKGLLPPEMTVVAASLLLLLALTCLFFLRRYNLRLAASQ